MKSGPEQSRFPSIVTKGPFRTTPTSFDTTRAVNVLKASGHPGRLAILRHLFDGEKSVGELEELMNTRQAAVSQQLARLRQEGLVSGRREGKTIFYKLTDPQVEHFVSLLHEVFSS